MKPLFERVTVAPGESWTLVWREVAEIPFLWHYHPEFELTLTMNARGQRYVGDHFADFGPGDLVLLGPSQPHTWAACERPDPARQTCISGLPGRHHPSPAHHHALLGASWTSASRSSPGAFSS